VGPRAGKILCPCWGSNLDHPVVYITNGSQLGSGVQISPKAPKLNAQITLHKARNPSHTVINSIDATTSTIAKIIQQLKEDTSFRNEFNTVNALDCHQNLEHLF
jgi:hypothetical protein